MLSGEDSPLAEALDGGYADILLGSPATSGSSWFVVCGSYFII